MEKRRTTKEVKIEKELKRVKIESLLRNHEFLSDFEEYQRLFNDPKKSDEDVKTCHVEITKKYGNNIESEMNDVTYVIMAKMFKYVA